MSNFTHGLSRTADHKHTVLYGRWSNIKDRCCNPNSKDWKRYGGRGISICDEWKNDYPAFKKWADENGFRPELQIDRIDNDKGYSPENCRFVTPKANSNNRRSSLKVSIGNLTYSILELSQITGIPWPTLYKKHKAGELENYVQRRAQNQVKHYRIKEQTNGANV